jgi:exopolysaccharide biosynthesis polyprenyl glycosylphosphotransferase
MANFARISLRNWIMGIWCLDLLGVACMVLALHRFPVIPGHGHLAAAIPVEFVQPLAANLVASVAIWLLAAHSNGLYQRAVLVAGRSTLPQASMTGVLAFGIMLLVALGAGPGDGSSGLRAVAVTAGAIAWIMGARACWHAGLRAVMRRGYCMDRALVLAASATAARYAASAIERRHDGRIRVAASAPFPNAAGGPSFDWIEDAVRSNIVDRVVIAGCDQASDAYGELLPWMTRLAADVTFVPGRPGGDVLAFKVGGSDFAPADDLANWPLSAGQSLAKRAEDIAVAAVLLVVTAPVMLLIALAIKLDSPGPAFFIQKRVGLRGAVFPMWKFRTMHHHLQDHGSSQQTRRNDERVTRIGRYLRRTSLDELPQLINVLRGDMSMVGPRPHALGMTVVGRQLQDIAEGYDARHLVKPGITGWAQVNGCRGEVDTERKLRRRLALDCHYIEHWSMRIDAWIMLRTATLFAFDRHAY